MAKEVVITEANPIGKKVRKYLIKREEESIRTISAEERFELMREIIENVEKQSKE